MQFTNPTVGSVLIPNLIPTRSSDIVHQIEQKDVLGAAHYIMHIG